MAKILKAVSLIVILGLVLSLGVGIFGVSSVATADTGGPDDFGYTFIDSDEPGGPVFDWVDISGSGTLSAVTDIDDASELVDIGFDFEFYGNTYDDVYISSNGFLTFDDDGADVWTNECIPDTDAPNDMIAPFWDDIDPYDGGDVYYETQGSGPNRQFIVQWHDVEHFDDPPGIITFEVILYEGSNNILFQYYELDFGDTDYDYGASATVGIENEDASDSLEYSCGEDALEDDFAILFSPAVAPAANFSASPMFGEGPLTVYFQDRSSGDVERRSWDFGDGGSSTSRSPSHTYQSEGVYTVGLTVTGPGGRDTETKFSYITVESAAAPMLAVRNLYITPAEVYSNDPVTISADVANNGGSWGSQDVELMINGEFEQRTGVGVSPGTAYPIRFTVYRADAGQYSVMIGEATGWFNVLSEPQAPPPSSQPSAGVELGTGGIIAIVVIGIVLIAGIVIAIIIARPA